jgi:autotransporter-associated beta strand protein
VGSVTKTGSGTLTLAGNSYSGSTLINAGIAQMGDSAALGSSASGTTVASGAELDIVASVTTVEPLTLSGAGVSGSGALVLQSGSGASTWNAQMTATADTVLGAFANTSLAMGGLNAGNYTMLFLPVNNASFTVSSNLTAGSVVVDAAGGLFLTAANDTLTNIVLNKANPTSGSISPTAGITAYHNHALGTNCSVTVSNANLIGNSGAIIRLGNNVTIPAGVSLNFVLPETGDSGPGQYRATLGVLGAPSTNIWNGPITIHGADPASGIASLFIIRPESSQITLNGDLTLADGAATVMVRGSSAKAVINGNINIGTNTFTPISDAGVTDVTLNSTANNWGLLQLASARLRLGANNAMPASAPVQQINTSAILELNGFNQQIGGLFSSAIGTVINSSTNTASTLTVSSASAANWIYTGNIANVSGAKALNLDVAGDTLTLTGPANNYAGSTTVRGGATLALSASGVITASTPIDLKAGGILDVSGTTSGGTSLGAGQKLMGNGTVTGNLILAGTIAPGESIGALTVSGNVTNSGTASIVMEVNNTTGTNDVLNVGGTLSYGGTLIITNISGTAYTNNQVIKLFNAAIYGGSFANIVFPGVGTYDASNLAVDGTIKVVSVVSTTPVSIVFSVTGGGNTMQLNWPADHTGWRLQSQTNAVSAGLKTNWATVPGSTSVNSMSFPINPANGAVFFRLVYP